MDNSERPRLALHQETAIEAAQNDTEKAYWNTLRTFLRILPQHRSSDPLAYPEHKTPARLKQTMAEYAALLFHAEAQHYPKGPKLEVWLENLARSVSVRAINTLRKLEEQASKGGLDLSHHGVSLDEIMDAMVSELENRIDGQLHPKPLPVSKAPPPPEPLGSRGIVRSSRQAPTVTTAVPPHVPTPTKPKRLPSTVHCPSAARRVEEFVQRKGMSMTEFATIAGTTDRTLRAFRKTGRVRRKVFRGIAEAMGLSPEQLIINQ